jgi:sugar phosphate isomerase/epimerase
VVDEDAGIPDLSRRQVLGVLGAAPLAILRRPLITRRRRAVPLRIGIASRHLQWTPLEDAAAVAADIGFDAIEWNVRRGGHVDPARVERDLPRAVDVTRQAGLSVDMITTSIQDAASPHVEAILRTARDLGIRHYRGGEYFRYDYARDLWQQLQDLKPRVASLAALNEKYGTVVAYHTHSGAGNIGGNIWDLWEVIRGFEPRLIGLNYDLGHATARGGAGWIDAAHVVARHVRALAIKDVKWVQSPGGGWRIEYCPLGDGMIDVPRMLQLLGTVSFDGPVNLHYEHSDLLGTDVGTWKLPITRQRFIAIVGKDLRYLRAQIKSADA